MDKSIEDMSLREKLHNIQLELIAPKSQYNSFGKYKYRSVEDIMESIKPLLGKYRTGIKIEDGLVNIGSRYYIESKVTLMDIDKEDEISSTAYARESEQKAGMDTAQITGSTSSYARKYALNGLFAIDDSKDVDYLMGITKEDSTVTENSKKTDSKDLVKSFIELFSSANNDKKAEAVEFMKAKKINKDSLSKGEVETKIVEELLEILK